MSKQTTRRAPQKRRPQQRKGRTAMAAKGGKANNRTTWILVGVVLLIGIALLVAVASSSDKSSGPSDAVKGTKPAPASLVSKVTGVSQDVIDTVATGSVTNPPKKISGTPLKNADGKPRIVYVGSNYCPFCATERWAMVNALSRFGEFKNLSITSSASRTPAGDPETNPTTGTFSFSGSTFTSPYITFEPTEQFSNEIEGQGYKPLDPTSPEVQAMLEQYNKGGGIPFINFANQYMISGASYDADVLLDKTRNEIAGELTNPSSDVTQGVVGAANVLTATICKVTGNKPADVCNTPTIQGIQGQLPS
jgi:hypothetical protein